MKSTMQSTTKSKLKLAVERTVFFLVTVLALTSLAAAQPAPAFPGIFKNAKYVYVTAYDGPEFDANVLPEDRQAISEVEGALREWGKYIVVLRPSEADMVLAVQRRGNEDVLAVYQPGNDSYRWRVMARGGLIHGELPLLQQMKVAVEKLDTSQAHK